MKTHIPQYPPGDVFFTPCSIITLTVLQIWIGHKIYYPPFQRHCPTEPGGENLLLSGGETGVSWRTITLKPTARRQVSQRMELSTVIWEQIQTAKHLHCLSWSINSWGSIPPPAYHHCPCVLPHPNLYPVLVTNFFGSFQVHYTTQEVTTGWHQL